MIELNKEYFNNPYYFFLKEKEDKIAVYYAVSDTIVESRRKDDVIEVDKEVFNDIQKLISKILKSGKKLTKDQVHKLIDSKTKKEEPEGEIEELVNPDGSIISSDIPILNQRNLAKKTTDQTVQMTKANQFPFIRVYYGESEEKNNNIVSEKESKRPTKKRKTPLSEVDQSESFGFEETEDAPTYDVANKIFKKMDVDDPIERDERLKRLGFDRNLDRELKQELGKNYSSENKNTHSLIKRINTYCFCSLSTIFPSIFHIFLTIHSFLLPFSTFFKILNL